MLYTEWNLEDAVVVARQEGHREGHDKGRREGHKEGRREEREEVLSLFNQGFSAEEIKQRLMEGVKE